MRDYTKHYAGVYQKLGNFYRSLPEERRESCAMAGWVVEACREAFTVENAAASSQSSGDSSSRHDGAAVNTAQEQSAGVGDPVA